MDGTIHIRNKNGRHISSKEIQTTSRRTSTLPLPPLISEDESILKNKQEEKKKYEKEERTRKEGKNEAR